MFSFQSRMLHFNHQEEPWLLRVNYGEKPFQYCVNASSFNQVIQPVNIKVMDSVPTIESGGFTVFRDKMNQDEDKLHKTLEKNYFKVSLLPDPVKSFSQFPPSIYRKSFAATRIQRVWRRYRGRITRQKMKKEQYDAACKIQRLARLKLRKLRQVKNIAAFKIQNCWRKKMLIWMALLRILILIN